MPIRPRVGKDRGWRGWAVSLLAHLLLLLVLARAVTHDLTRASEAIPGGTAAPGGGGGGDAGYISLPALRPSAPIATRPVAPVEAPTAPVSPPVTPPDSTPPPEPASVAVASQDSATAANGEASGVGPGTGGGAGGGIGTGIGTGTGAGEGPGTGGGPAESRGTAPQARQIILPPEDRPSDLRGVSLRVTFHVDAQGRVEQVEVDPEIKDHGYAKKFMDVMRKYQFRPARTPDGTAVRGVAVIVVTL
ncbi:MAG TPA: hypothetical protein VLT17_11415 [Gemmatimonadales bacterium]|nr:hypothetical protein [Gemmatimonadales bacterium]